MFFPEYADQQKPTYLSKNQETVQTFERKVGVHSGLKADVVSSGGVKEVDVALWRNVQLVKLANR